MPIDLSTLNDGQLAAVRAPIDKPCLVIAGAGSGKTTTLTARLEEMVREGVDPDDLVAMTFTKKAAGEFAERLGGGPAAAVWSGTIHSFAYARVRAYREALDEPALAVIVHPKTHIRKLIGSRPWTIDGDYAGHHIRHVPENLDLSEILGWIDMWQNELIDPSLAADIADGHTEVWAARIYQGYTTWKRSTDHIDFGDMLSLAVDAYQDDHVFLAGDRARYPYALVDELQDTNTAQWRLCQLLWSGQPLFGVGDPRQAIYEWRGARPGQLLAFADLWPGVEIVKLVDNYRSTPQIVNVAEDLMAKTVEAEASGRLRPNRKDGPAPVLAPVWSQAEEAEMVAELIQAGKEGDLIHRWGSAAVLYRTNAQSVDFEDVFAAREIPYQVIGSKGFWARTEVRQLLAYLELAEEPDHREAFALAIGAPSRYLGKAFVAAASDLAHEKGWTITEACAHVVSYNGRGLNRGQSFEASNFTSLVGSITGMGPAEGLEFVLQTTDFVKWLRRNEGMSDGADDNREDALSKLVEQARAFDTRAGLLTHAEKMRSKAGTAARPDPNRVQVMTIHRAKGLEWPWVFVAGFCEGLLPHWRGNPAEERRLAYVAMTRARDRLWLISPENTYRGPSGISEFAVEAGLWSRAEAMGVPAQ